MNSLCSWSGGKDSCYALMKSIERGFMPAVLLNVLNEDGKISRSHGIPSAVIQLQALRCGIPVSLLSSSWEDYETKFTNELKTLKKKHDLTHAVFGDIDLDAHRDWEEKVCLQAGITAVLPLWKFNRLELFYKMIDAGISTMIISCNNKMGESFLGRILTRELVPELQALDIDVCGENGEYHTLVLDCPLFSAPIQIFKGEKLVHNDYHFLAVSIT